MRRLAAGFAVSAAACGFSASVAGDGAIGGGEGVRDAAPDAEVVSPAWAFKRKLTINNGGLAEQTEFALAVVLDGTRITYASTQATGADVRIGDAAGNFLPYEIERWDPAGRSVLWARVPTIAAGVTTDVYLYYGNPSATDAQAPAAVWDDDYVGVWHLADAHDSTGNNTSTNNGATPRAAGAIGPALEFSGANDQHVDTGNATQLSRWTIELWANPATGSVAGANLASSLVSRFPNYMLLWSCNGVAFCRRVMFDGSAGFTHNAEFTATVGAWTHVVGRYDGMSLQGYSNGGLVGTELTNDTPQLTNVTAKIGSRMDLAGDFNGGIDEVRISRIARSFDYIRAHVRSTSDTYLTYGPEEAN